MVRKGSFYYNYYVQNDIWFFSTFAKGVYCSETVKDASLLMCKLCWLCITFLQ